MFRILDDTKNAQYIRRAFSQKRQLAINVKIVSYKHITKSHQNAIFEIVPRSGQQFAQNLDDLVDLVLLDDQRWQHADDIGAGRQGYNAMRKQFGQFILYFLF